MKKTIVRLAGLALVMGVLAQPAMASALKMEVHGLVCAFCAKGIQSAFEKEPGVQEIYVSLENKLVAVDLKEGADLSNERATELLTQAGYTVKGIERVDVAFESLKVPPQK